MTLSLFLRIAAVVLSCFALACVAGAGTVFSVGAAVWFFAALLAFFLDRLLADQPIFRGPGA